MTQTLKIQKREPEMKVISGQQKNTRIIETHYLEIQPIDFYEQKHVRHLMRAELVAVLLNVIAFISLLPTAIVLIAIDLMRFANSVYAIAYVLIAVVLSFFIIEVAISISYFTYKRRYE